MNKLIDNKSIDSMRRIINCAVIFSLFLIVLFTCPVGAATYYVKNGGNDSLNGLSDSTAWATTAKVMATVTSGDIVYFRSQDTWTSSSSPTLNVTTAGVTYDGSTWGSGTRATITTAYTPTQSIVLGIVRLSASNTTFKGFNVDVNDKRSTGIWVGSSSANIDNVTIDDCVVHNNTGVSGDWHYGILVTPYSSTGTAYTNSNITIQNCEIYDTFHEAIGVYAAWTRYRSRNNGVLIRNNYIHNSGGNNNPTATSGCGVEVANDSDNVVVEFNTIYETYGPGIAIRNSPSGEGSANRVSGPEGTIIRYNIIARSNSNGIQVWNPEWHSGVGDVLPITADIYGNIFYNNGVIVNPYRYAHDFYIEGHEGYHDGYLGCTFNIYNNIFYNVTTIANDNNNASVSFGSTGVMNDGTVNFRNNIIYFSSTTSDYGALYYRMSGTTFNYSNNIIYRADGGSKYAVFNASGTDYTNSGVSTWEANSYGTNPGFTGGTLPTGFSGTYGTNMVPNTTYFALGSASPAINAGATLISRYNGCINGAGLATPVTRPQGSGYDIGAYEYVEAGGVVTPPVVTPPVVTPPAVTPPAAPKNLRVIE